MKKQKGIATTLIMIIVGLSLTASTLGVMYMQRASQETSMSLHAKTQAQLKVWGAAELVQNYLQGIQDTKQMVDFANYVKNGKTLNLKNASGAALDGVTVNFVSYDSEAFKVLISAVTADNTKAKSTASLEAIYKITGSEPVESEPNVMTFNRNLKLGGSINVLKNNNDTKKYTINVLGDFSTDGNSIVGLSRVQALGSINITSGSAFEELSSNCDVSLSGSVTASVIKARRNVCLTGASAASSLIAANGSVSAQSGYAANGTISARTNYDGLLTTTLNCVAPGSVNNFNLNEVLPCPVPTLLGVSLAQGGAGAKIVATKANVSLGGGGRIGTMWKTLLFLPLGGGTTVDKNVLGIVTDGPTLTQNGSIAPLAEREVYKVETITLAADKYNAYNDRDSANFEFTIDSKGFKRVKVRNVSGVDNGDYYLGDYDGGFKDYLCTEVSGSSGTPKCTKPAKPLATICKGYSEYNNCFSYSNNKWTINGVSAAPGVMWFEGNLEVGNGTYYNTFIATGFGTGDTIVTSGSHVTYAPNYAGYSGRVDGEQFAPTGICQNANFAIYPTQFCNKATTTYIPQPIGNYAFKAGSGSTNYVGGNIKTGSSSDIFGNILAGNEFNSGGSTTVHGYISALAQGSKTYNSMGGSTSIDLRKLPNTYNTTSTTTPGTSGSAGSKKVVILWSRYL